MLDIRLIRDKPDFVRERLATRGGEDEGKIDEVLRIDVERRKSETQLQRLESERIVSARRSGGEVRATTERRTRIGSPKDREQITNINGSAPKRLTTSSAICFSILQTCRMRPFRLARMPAQIEFSAPGARSRNRSMLPITLPSARN